jgi:sigma-B regulation protein RsbU (phosphoserine phosphatase)
MNGLEEATAVLGTDSFACVPLLDPRGAVLGFIEVGARDRIYAPEDARRLAALGDIAARRLCEVAGGERRLAKEELSLTDVAQRLQRRLLPGEAPTLAGVDIAFAYRSASAGVLSGGDFVDYYTRPPSPGLAFAIGDVAGKGVDAMTTTFVTKYILRAAVQGGLLSWPARPGEALQELRNGLLEQPDFAPESERFVTVLFGQLNPKSGVLQLASAGHPTPFLIRRDTVERPLLMTEPAMGIELSAALEPYPSESLHLTPGDLLVFFTDGIAELRDDEGGFFEEHMAAALAGMHGRSAADVVSELLAAGEDFSVRPAADDVAILCVGLTDAPAVN